MADDWFNRAFSPVSDVREALLEGWFGRNFERRAQSGEGFDRVLDAKSFPDKIDDKLLLQSLEAELDQRAAGIEPASDRDRGIDL